MAAMGDGAFVELVKERHSDFRNRMMMWWMVADSVVWEMPDIACDL